MEEEDNLENHVDTNTITGFDDTEEPAQVDDHVDTNTITVFEDTEGPGQQGLQDLDRPQDVRGDVRR